MQKIIWTEQFSVGVATLNEQHKRIIRMVNKLLTEPEVLTGSHVISDLLSDMTRYAQEHFRVEEELMDVYGYGDFHTHKKSHLIFREKTVQLCQATMINVEIVPVVLQNFFYDWWTNHILQEDMQYKPFFESKGVV